MRAKRTISILAFAAAAVALAAAQENSADLFGDAGLSATAPSDSLGSSDSSGAKDSGFILRLSGDDAFTYRMPAYPDSWNYSGSIKQPRFTNDFGAEVQDGAVKLVSHWGLDVYPLAASASSPNDSWSKVASLTPYENYISWSPAGLKLTAGYQVFSWGVADKKNPTDNLNPRDYTVGPNADKIPVLAGDLVAYPTDWLSLEAVFLPSKPASQYPMDFADLIVKNGQGMITSGMISYDDKTAEPWNGVTGAKVNIATSAVDVSLDYLYDVDQFYTPVITGVATQMVSGMGPVYMPTGISLERKRIHRFGADAKTTLGRFGLWLEGAYNLTENSGSDDYSVRKSKFEYTLGTDANFGENDSGYVNVQYIGSWIPDYDTGTPSTTAIAQLAGATASSATRFYQRSAVNQLGLDTEGLMQGATVNVKYSFAGGLVTPQVTAVYMKPFFYDDSTWTRYGSLVLNPEIDLMPVDSFHIKVGADLCYAWRKNNATGDVSLDTATDPVGAYTTSNSVYLAFEYKWNADIKK